MTWALIRSDRDKPIYSNCTVGKLIGEWSDSQIQEAAQKLAVTPHENYNDICRIIEDFLPAPLRDAL